MGISLMWKHERRDAAVLILLERGMRRAVVTAVRRGRVSRDRCMDRWLLYSSYLG